MLQKTLYYNFRHTKKNPKELHKANQKAKHKKTRIGSKIYIHKGVYICMSTTDKIVLLVNLQVTRK